jgi:hypothetical protein
VAVLAQGLVLSSKSKPVMAKTRGELPGIWDRIWGFYVDDDSAEGYSGQTR